MTVIAGHSFIDAPHGRVCSACNKRWVDIAGVQREHINQPGWAHVGNLTEVEFNEIVSEVNRTWEAGR